MDDCTWVDPILILVSSLIAEATPIKEWGDHVRSVRGLSQVEQEHEIVTECVIYLTNE
jgi:hypothetical protein